MNVENSPGVLRYNNDGSHNNSAEEIDLRSESDENEERGVSNLAAVFIVCNAALGAGLLNFPYAYALAGNKNHKFYYKFIV